MFVSNLFFINFSLANNNFGADTAARTAFGETTYQKVPKDVSTAIGNVIGALLSLISVIFFVLMIYGGIRWMFARGNEDEAKKAADTILAAIIGLIIIVASYALTNFVFKAVMQGGNTVIEGQQRQ